MAFSRQVSSPARNMDGNGMGCISSGVYEMLEKFPGLGVVKCNVISSLIFDLRLFYTLD